MIDADGYVHSGDLGTLEDGDKLSIRGRLKELIITSGGENVAPVFCEHLIKEALPGLVANCMVIGDRRKFLSALISLKTVPDAATGQPTKVLLPQIVTMLETAGSHAKTTTEAVNDPVVLQFLQQGIDKANEKAVSNAQQIRKFVVIENDFSLGGGELTPTMKLKRKVVAEKYAAVIEHIYQE
jgi:long-chain-fatty-acid--CoA ligase ACSBG